MKQWIVHIAAASLLSAIAMALTPKGRVRQVTRLACGLMCALTVAGPLVRPDLGGISAMLAQYRQRAGLIVAQAGEEEKLMERTYIEQQCEAYILGKADERGLALGGVDVTARWDAQAGVWYPWQAALDAPFDSGLSVTVEAQLGIPAERQQWRDDG